MGWFKASTFLKGDGLLSPLCNISNNLSIASLLQKKASQEKLHQESFIEKAFKLLF